MAVTKVAIVGFTGKMGRLITNSLLRSHPTVQIHGICRSPSKVDTKLLSNPNVKVFAAEWNDSVALRKALADTSVCICCYLGDHTLMIEGQKTLIDAAIAEKVPRYIASDWSLDFRGLEFGEHPQKDPMKHIQLYLEEKEKANLIKGVHVLNGAFMEIVVSPHAPWMNAAEGIFHHYGTGDEKVDMTTYEDSAKFTAEVAVDEDSNGFIKVLGDSLSVKEMAKAYQDVYGIEPKVERLGSQEELFEKMTGVFKKNPTNIYAWNVMYYQHAMAKEKTQLGKVDNDRYPSMKPKSLADFFRSFTKDRVGKSGQF